MKEKVQAPELRFDSFTDDWEERKLGEHAKYRRGSFPQPYGNKEWYDGEGAMPFVQVVDVTNKLTLVENTKQKISKLAQSKSVFVPKGTVVVTLQGSIGRVAITQYDSFVDRTLLIFEDYEKETDERFWAYTIQKKFEIEKLKAPGGTIKTITKEALSSFDVHLPQFKEQEKIGSFFQQLDETIALHQRKLDLLKEQKKGYLQKMFPKNGAKVPELRFAGFANDWEERKLEDISEIIDGDRGKNYPSGDDFKNNGHTLFLSAANVTKQGFVFKETQYITKLKSESLGSGKVILNDIILTSRGSIGHIGFYDKKTHEYIPQARINSGMLILRTDKLNSPSFIAQFLKSPWGIKQIKLISFGSAQPQLTKKDIKNFKIILPKMEEQEKIGSFFQKLDDTIALHQRKLDLLKEQKKGFLQKMFV
ncbi:restriction endonuclease subunit S [Lactococcus lactis]|uniref:restriction endonuclease subunit S n=1 Tax=Lactococcus lactis TaxID=1358 RepID=UPI0024A75F88|nr:restriction endonuclease subunit S [Lactococcus lactis]